MIKKSKINIFLFISILLVIFEHLHAISNYGFTNYTTKYWIQFFHELPGSFKSGINSQVTDILYLVVFFLYFIRYNLIELWLSILIYFLMYFKFIELLFDFKNDFHFLALFIIIIGFLVGFLKSNKYIYLVLFIISLLVIYFDIGYACLTLFYHEEAQNKFYIYFRNCAGIYARITSYFLMIIIGLTMIKIDESVKKTLI